MAIYYALRKQQRLWASSAPVRLRELLKGVFAALQISKLFESEIGQGLGRIARLEQNADFLAQGVAVNAQEAGRLLLISPNGAQR